MVSIAVRVLEHRKMVLFLFMKLVWLSFLFFGGLFLLGTAEKNLSFSWTLPKFELGCFLAWHSKYFLQFIFTQLFILLNQPCSFYFLLRHFLQVYLIWCLPFWLFWYSTILTFYWFFNLISSWTPCFSILFGQLQVFWLVKVWLLFWFEYF